MFKKSSSGNLRKNLAMKFLPGISTDCVGGNFKNGRKSEKKNDKEAWDKI